MAEDASATTQNPTAPRIDKGSGPKAAAPPRNKPEEQAKLLPEANTDPMRELLEHLERAQPLIANLDRNLAETIQTLARQGADPEHRTQPAFRHQVAYAVQDLEKSAIWPIAMAPELRSEMTTLAATAPGLENERMGVLMREMVAAGPVGAAGGPPPQAAKAKEAARTAKRKARPAR